MRRAAWIPPILVVLGIALIAAELVVLGYVASLIGLVPALGITIVFSGVGIWLAKREGAKAWRALAEAVTLGRMPTGQLADAALVLVGGLLLFLPGYVSDLLGLLLLLPLTRSLVRSALAFLAGKWLLSRGAAPTTVKGEVVPDQTTDTTSPRQDPPVLEGRILEP
ncbi:MAG: FxsA family protein [Propionibacteriaceae bacterium]|nr:FxsA family protein [Propionibacteriaceae bacterium]